MIPLHYSEGRGGVSNRRLQSGQEPPILPPRPTRPPCNRDRRKRSGSQRPVRGRRVAGHGRPHQRMARALARREETGYCSRVHWRPNRPICFPLHHKMREFCSGRHHILRIDSISPIRKNHLDSLSEHNGEKMFKTKRVEADGSGEESVLSSTDVSRLSGVSLRQLQWWDEQKVVSPHHAGHRRLYSLEEVVEVSVIAELRKKGF